MDFIEWCPLKGLVGSRGKKGKMWEGGDEDVVLKVESENEVVETKVEEGMDGETVESTSVRPKRKARRGKKVKDEGSGGEGEGVEEVVKKKKVKVGRKVEDDEREMSGIPGGTELAKSLRDDELKVLGGEDLH
ncbi:BQ5605_C043g12080 [Microbotryum silenes-dioicae]|uniref:BQ5605_C006g03992 protein n=1 Tax=Microbotryum silenes-dioicae TaxID=796604 RepID=A0A2X0MTL6_9BASI|nr:BQ5605_C006g03992 [Microbotryum silenes-dioicae]SGZ32116.1 BQ5605_C043g12080 [Microbotryum silenes-dioicae]